MYYLTHTKRIFSVLVLFLSLVAKGQNPCYLDLVKKIELETRYGVVLDDVPELLPNISYALRPIGENADFATRMKTLKQFPIGDIVVAPGHRFLADVSQEHGLVKYIKDSNGGDFSKDKILLNIMTNADGRIKSIDLWNAHHRLVAYIEAGYKFLGEIPEKNFTILVNGHTTTGEKWGHFLPSAGLDLKNAKFKYTSVPAGNGVRPGTVNVDGALSNFELGSRTSLRALHSISFAPKKAKVGVYFGTFDPLHEGHMGVVKNAIDELGLDAVVLVPNATPLHKPNATPLQHRLSMVADRIKDEKKLNLFIGDSNFYIEANGDNSLLIERIKQIYGTNDVYHLMGQDSYEKLMTYGQIRPDANRVYYITPRGDMGPPHVPPHLNDKVKVANRYKDELKLSSTRLRNMMQDGEQPPANWMFPATWEYIREMGLYK